jgi:hypothetical protein
VAEIRVLGQAHDPAIPPGIVPVAEAMADHGTGGSLAWAGDGEDLTNSDRSYCCVEHTSKMNTWQIHPQSIIMISGNTGRRFQFALTIYLL